MGMRSWCPLRIFCIRVSFRVGQRYLLPVRFRACVGPQVGVGDQRRRCAAVGRQPRRVPEWLHLPQRQPPGASSAALSQQGWCALVLRLTSLIT
jgi:hypothetical protein